MQPDSAAPYLHLGPGEFARISITIARLVHALCCATAYEHKKYLSKANIVEVLTFQHCLMEIKLIVAYDARHVMHCTIIGQLWHGIGAGSIDFCYRFISAVGLVNIRV
jgi:hypothetical protein